MAKYDLDLRMGIDDKLVVADVDVGALSYSVDKLNLYIDALKEDKATIERLMVNADKAYAIRDKDEDVIAEAGAGKGSLSVGVFSNKASFTATLIHKEGSADATYIYDLISGVLYIGESYALEYEENDKIIYFKADIIDSNTLFIHNFSIQMYSPKPNKKYNFIKNYSGALGETSLAVGFNASAMGKSSFSLGENSKAKGDYSYALGNSALAYGESSFAEGVDNSAYGKASHAEGDSNTAYGYASHAEGNSTYAYAPGTHTEGNNTKAFGNYSYTEGLNTITLGDYSHIEGKNTFKDIRISTTRGSGPNGNEYVALDYGSNGGGTAPNAYWHFPGKYLCSGSNEYSLIINAYENEEGYVTIVTEKPIADLKGNGWTTFTICDGLAKGEASHVEGDSNLALLEASHAEGKYTISNGDSSHAEGIETFVSGDGAHAEGYLTAASDRGAHAEGGYHDYMVASDIFITGDGTTPTYTYTGSLYGFNLSENPGIVINNLFYLIESFTSNTITFDSSPGPLNNYKNIKIYFSYAAGEYSHSEGSKTKAIGNCSHAEGFDTLALGGNSHAGGMCTEASGGASFANGLYTIASGTASSAFGKYNKPKDDNENSYLFTVGNGTSTLRSNLFSLSSDNLITLNGATTINSTLNVSSNTTINSTLNVNGNTTINGSVYAIDSTSTDKTPKELATVERVEKIASSITTKIWEAGSTPPTDTKLLWIRTGSDYGNGILYYYTGNTSITGNYNGWIPMSAIYS